MSSARSSIFCVVILILLSIAIAHADETDDARRVALEILQKVEQKKNAKVWQQDVSNWFKETIASCLSSEPERDSIKARWNRIG